MQDEILDDLVNESITRTHVKASIQDAISHYEQERFYFNESQTSFSTVAGTEYYSSTNTDSITTMVSIVSLQAGLSGSYSVVRPVDFKTIESLQDGNVTGFPTLYAFYLNRIRLYPIPDDVYSMAIDYVSKLDTLSADDDSNAWTTYGEDLIRAAATRRLATRKLQDDQMAGRFGMMEMEAYEKLRAATRRKMPNTTLQVPAMLGVNTFNINVG
jgi:hypothetical protein